MHFYSLFLSRKGEIKGTTKTFPGPVNGFSREQLQEMGGNSAFTIFISFSSPPDRFFQEKR